MVNSAVEAFVDEHGVTALAAAVGKSQSAIRLWKHRHVIPRAHWPELMTAVSGLTLEKLKQIEALSAPFAAEQKRRAA